MRISKILFLLAVGLLSINARVSKRQKKIRQGLISYTQTPPQCGPPISLYDIPYGSRPFMEAPYGNLGPCNSQNIYYDEVPGYNYAVLNSELANYGRMPAVKLPNIANSNAPVPAINMAGLYDFVVELPDCPAIPYVTELPCQCKAPALPYQCIESPCSCRMQAPVEYLSSVDIAGPILRIPFAEPSYAQAPRCKCQQLEKRICGCQTTPCSYQNVISTPYGYDNGIKVPYGLPCGCESSLSCGCQKAMQLPQLPAYIPSCGCQSCQLSPIELPAYIPSCSCQSCQLSPVELPAYIPSCGCQGCQLSPVELPVYDCNCQSLPPPVIGCGGKYLRQITLQPPFL